MTIVSSTLKYYYIVTVVTHRILHLKFWMTNMVTYRFSDALKRSNIIEQCQNKIFKRQNLRKYFDLVL